MSYVGSGGRTHLSGDLAANGVSVGGAYDYPRKGGQFFIDTVHGSDGADGNSWTAALKSMTEVLTRVTSDTDIFVRGRLAEHCLAPLGVYGVRIFGAAGGRPRHSTSGGVVLDGNAASWVESATSTNSPLLELREQGWEVHNMLMVPKSGYGAIKLHREETATYPDASHFVMTGCKIISSGTRVGLGIDDSGASYHILVEDNEFVNLEYAYKASGVGIAAPGAHAYRRNRFSGNKNDIYGNFYGSEIYRNIFCTPYNASTHPNTVNLAATADAGSATDANYVIENYFADAEAVIVDQTKGYKSATGDVWRNFATASAAFIVEAPSAA